MTDAALTHGEVGRSGRPALDGKPTPVGALAFVAVLVGGLLFAGMSILNDVNGVGQTLALGAFFPTTTKEAGARAELDLLEGWQQGFETPCVAIGGITVETASTVARAGADFLAVSAGVWAHSEGPAAAVRAFGREMAAGVAERG